MCSKIKDSQMNIIVILKVILIADKITMQAMVAQSARNWPEMQRVLSSIPSADKT